MANTFLTLDQVLGKYSAENHNALVKEQEDRYQLAISRFTNLMGRHPSKNGMDMAYLFHRDFQDVLETWEKERATNRKG